jgi:hypothetical protein
MVSVGMRRHGVALGSVIAIGVALGAPSPGAALSVPCCPHTVANAPCSTIVYNTSEGSPSAGLRSLLAPLRRAQTPADIPPRRGPERSVISFGEEFAAGEGVRTKYIRRAAVIHGESLYLVPVARACDEGYPVREAVFLFAVGLHGSSTSGAGTAASIKRQGIQGGFGWGGEGNAGTERVPGTVPPGVAKVTLLYTPGRGLPASVTVAVVHNVYDAFVPYSSTQTGEYPEGPRELVWRSRRGKVLKTFPF